MLCTRKELTMIKLTNNDVNEIIGAIYDNSASRRDGGVVYGLPPWYRRMPVLGCLPWWL